MIVQQEKDLSGRKPSPKMIEALARVVATNGGGVSYYDYPKSVWQGLLDRGLAQGKLGNPSRVVHTKDGLEFIKQSLKPQPRR